MSLQFRTPFVVSLFAALLLGNTAPLLAQKGGNKPPTPTYAYKFTNLGQLAYTNYGGGAKAYSINEPDNSGALLAVAGGSSTPSPAFATCWEATAGGSLLDVSTISGSQRGTVAVNDLGWIAFYGYSPTQAANVGMVHIPGIGNVELSAWIRPTALNNFGQVVATDGTDGYLWTVAKDGAIKDAQWLGDFIPFAINDWGDMAGQQGSSAAIAWFDAGQLQVQKLPRLYAGDFGRAAGINNLGEVVGLSATNAMGSALTGNYRPFLWRATGELVALADSGAALDINDRGQVVGWSFNSSGFYAFLWENGVRRDLNALSGIGTKSFRLEAAEAINNAGHVVGRSGSYKGSTTVGNGSFLLTPN